MPGNADLRMKLSKTREPLAAGMVKPSVETGRNVAREVVETGPVVWGNAHGKGTKRSIRNTATFLQSPAVSR